MIFSNRIINRFDVHSLLFILIASSIPNIHANTNPENPEILVQEQNVQSPSLVETFSSTREADTAQPANADSNIKAAQDPVEFQLNVLAGMCEYIFESLEKGKWNLPHDEAQKKMLRSATLDTFDVTSTILKLMKEEKQGITAQYLYTLVAHYQLEILNSLLQRKALPESSLEEEIKAAQTTEKTADELMQLMIKVQASFEKLHHTLLDLDALEADDELQDSTSTPQTMSALDRTNDQVLKQLCFVDAILEELALFIDNNSLKVKDKSNALASIRNARAIIESRKYDRGQVTEATIHDLLTLNKYLIGHVRSMISGDFNTIPALDETVLTTRTKREVTLEELDEKYQDNEIVLAKLRAESQTAGLKNYHLFFRALEPYWNKTLDGGRRLLWPTSAAGLAALTCQQMGISLEPIDFTVPILQMNFWGDRYKVSRGFVEAPERPGLVSEAFNFIPHFTVNPMALALIGTTVYYGASDWKLMRKTANDYLAKLTTFLLGRKETKDRSILTHVVPKYTFKDVVGQEEIKDALSILVRYFEDPQGIDNRGLDLEKGYLFTGKTRSGKSFMAEALAGEIREALKRCGKDEKTFRFIIAPQEILRQPGGFQACMEHARRYAPCILFIDEIHLLDLQAGKNNPLLSEFLNELSGCLDKNAGSKVFVIAATNHEDAIDKPLRSSGRLGKEIHFEYPTYANRRTFTVNILEKRTVNVKSDKWSRAINQFARETEDCNYEDIRKTIEAAFIDGKFEGASIEPAHLNHSLDKNIRGFISGHDHDISEQERHIVAAHQAGYALASRILAPYLSIAKVTIQPIREAIKERSLWSQWNEKNESTKNDRVVHGKMFTYGKKTRDMLVTIQEQMNACIIASSGYAAGNVQLGSSNNSSAYLPEKHQEAFDIAKMMITKGIKIDDFNDGLKNEFLKRALALRGSCEAKAAMLMEQNKEALSALYNALLKHGTLTGKAVDNILAQFELKGLEHDQNIFNFIETTV
jgi:ATP-dependent Zn protease